MAKTLLLARVLVDTMLFAIAVKANQLVEGEPELLKLYVKSGELDDAPAAVKYCKEELGAKPILITKPMTAAEIAKQELDAKRAAAEKTVADLQVQLDAAADDAKAGIQKQLDEAKAVLEALK